MNRSAEITTKQNKERRQLAAILIAVFVFVVAGVFAFFKFYNSYIDKTLYSERLNQMREVTTQLFSGLEDVVKNQWRDVSEQSRILKSAHPETVDEFIELMKEQSYLSDMESVQSSMIAVDENGMYYTQTGRHGLLPEREYIKDRPERISYVSNSMISNETEMVFIQKLDEPVSLKDGSRETRLLYYGISQKMEELNPYFDCSAYNGANSVYVVDDDGLKLFSSSGNDILKGFNIYNTLNEMDYLHGTSFADAKSELSENGIAYSNALFNNTELYYALYKMENAAWTLIFLVPSQYVAMNTVALINMTVMMVLIFAVCIIIISASLIFWLLKMQQKNVLETERRSNESLARINEELYDAVQTAERASREAEMANKAKSDFLANMSHDIRTPMNAIVGITSLMESEEGTSDKLHTYIQKVQLSSRHLLSLINDILDMSKIESSDVSLSDDPIDLAEQIGQVENIIRPQAEEKGQRFSIYVHEIEHEYIRGDGVRLRQIFINLLSNAVKYTQAGGSFRLDLTEIPCDKPEHASFKITVTDNGYGMTPEFVEHIFEPFTRAENSTTNRIQGTGLGMAITKNIVDMMNGDIHVTSEVDRGSCFEVSLTFPVDHSMDAEHETDIGSVLLVSDDQILAVNIAASLSDTPVILNTVNSQADAEEFLRRNSVDAVLLAGRLHDSGISDIIGSLRSSASGSILVFCCDYAHEDNAYDIAVKNGADGLVQRPFFYSNLLDAVERTHNANDPEKYENTSILNGMRFMCAEDNELNAEILEAVLEVNGASCVIYPDGEKITEAFESVKPDEYDAILMDVQMPRMNGLEASRRIRRSRNPLGKTIPIIAMTANAFSTDVQNCLDAGMDAHVAKPLDIGVLEQTLSSMLKNSGGGQRTSDQRKMQ